MRKYFYFSNASILPVNRTPSDRYFVKYKGLNFLVNDYIDYVDVDISAYCPECDSELMEDFSIIGSNFYCIQCDKSIRLWNSFKYLHHCVTIIEKSRNNKTIKKVSRNS